MIRTSSRLFLYTTLCVTGCAINGENAGTSQRSLPFLVQLNEITVPSLPPEPAGQDEPSDDPSTPRFTGDPENLTRLFANALERKGVFTQVVTGEADADLELNVRIESLDFGSGETNDENDVLSTTLWLSLGHFSWFVEDLTYPRSEVRATLEFVKPRQGPVVETRVLITGLQLNMWERVTWRQWFSNVFLPPYTVPGDALKAGSELSKKAMEYLAVYVDENFRGELQRKHLEKLSCSLEYDDVQNVLTLTARKAVTAVSIRRENASTRTLRPEEVARLAAPGLEVGAQSGLRFYKIPLLDGETGLLRVHVRIRGEGASWTILRA